MLAVSILHSTWCRSPFSPMRHLCCLKTQLFIFVGLFWFEMHKGKQEKTCVALLKACFNSTQHSGDVRQVLKAHPHGVPQAFGAVFEKYMEGGNGVGREETWYSLNHSTSREQSLHQTKTRRTPGVGLWKKELGISKEKPRLTKHEGLGDWEQDLRAKQAVFL